MRVAVVDADLLVDRNHHFPNLAAMKLASYWKGRGASVSLRMSYDGLDGFDEVYCSKVFTWTPVPPAVENDRRVRKGGTGFFFDKAEFLPREVEHCKPDFDLYRSYLGTIYSPLTLFDEGPGKPCADYTDYSIGFLTRGCFRRCPFCVNQRFRRVSEWSPLEEFVDEDRPKIMLLDDNFMGCGADARARLLAQLRESGKPFVFKQGLDVRLLSEADARLLFKSKYDGRFIFAFDNVGDYKVIESKLGMMRRLGPSIKLRFYVLCGFDSVGAEDIENVFIRLALLFKYRALPYVMRYRGPDGAPYKTSRWERVYNDLAAWANQPHLVVKLTFFEYCEKSGTPSAADFAKCHPDIAKRWFGLKWGAE